MDGLEVLLRATFGLPHIPFYFQRGVRSPQTGIGLCFFRDMPVKDLSKPFGGKVLGLHPISSFGTAFIVFFYQDSGFFLAFCPPAPFTFLSAPDQYPVHFTGPFQWMGPAAGHGLSCFGHEQPIGLLVGTKFSGHYSRWTALCCGGHPEEDKKSFAQGGILPYGTVCLLWLDWYAHNFYRPGHMGFPSFPNGFCNGTYRMKNHLSTSFPLNGFFTFRLWETYP